MKNFILSTLLIIPFFVFSRAVKSRGYLPSVKCKYAYLFESFRSILYFGLCFFISGFRRNYYGISPSHKDIKKELSGQKQRIEGFWDFKLLNLT